MKTTTTFPRMTLVKGIVILAASLMFQAGAAEAKSPHTLVRPNDVADVTQLAPVAPSEADFNDIPPFNTATILNTILAPVTPKEATFDDTIPVFYGPSAVTHLLAPALPREADFMDTILPTPDNYLMPVAPREALFFSE